MAEIQSGAVVQQGGRIRDITGYQWLVLFIAWAGWSLDITDFTLYGLVLRQALTELLGGNPTIAQIGSVGGLITTVGLLGWAVGGFVFGIIADYIGRVRTLALSILIYSVFTALQGFAQEAWQLGLFRFIAGLGTGAELMIAIPLVAEAFAERHRAKLLGFLLTGRRFGNLSAAYIADVIGRRPTIVVYSLGTLIVGLYLFLGVSSYGPYPVLLLIYGFFVVGIFSGHAIYMSELFPTHVRSTAVAFCNGSGRIFTSFGPLVAGLLVVQLGGLSNATGIMTAFAVLSLVAVFLGRETRDEQLPR